MGLVLTATCEGCGFQQPDLRLGATHAQIAQHDVCHRDLYRASCCNRVQSVLLYLGQPLPEVACEGCGQALVLTAETRYRIATMKGEVLEGHACPGCGSQTLSFQQTGKFV